MPFVWGNGSTYQGQSGRLVMNNYHVMPEATLILSRFAKVSQL